MVLPTFLICGAQKAGTTALYEAVQKHPDVCVSRPKETEFFSWRYRRGWAWFSTHFGHYDGEAAIGEASSRTMPTPEAPERIAERLSDIKLIFVLRNPVERAHSAFWYYVTQGILCAGESFGTFIRNEGHPLRQEIIRYGFYGRHLDRFLDVFGRSQILLLRHRDLRRGMDDELECVFRFLGVDETVRAVSENTEKNETAYPVSRELYAFARRIWKPIDRSLSIWAPDLISVARRKGKGLFLQGRRPKMDESDRAYLVELYASTKRTLEVVFGLDLEHWDFH